MTDKIVMQAPKGTTEAVIEGHRYEIPSSGKITVVNPDHVATLRRHGFIDSVAELSTEELEAKIEAMDDKQQLVDFIEERGGEADTDMSFKKLRKLALAAARDED